MKRLLAGIAVVGTLTLGGATGVVPIPTVNMDEATGYVTVPIFNTPSGELEDGQYALLEDGLSIAVHLGDYIGPPRDKQELKHVDRVAIIGHKSIGTYRDADGLSYLTDIGIQDAKDISDGKKVTRIGFKLKKASVSEAAIANTASKTYAGRNLVTSSTTDVTISSGDTAVVYGGFDNNGGGLSMSLSCTTGTVLKTAKPFVGGSAGDAHSWVIVNPTVGTNTCTLTASSSTFMLAQVSNYSGTLTSASTILDSIATTTCSASTSCSTSVTTGNAGSWLVGFSVNSSGAPTAGAGTTIRVSDTNGVGLGDSNAAVSPGSNTLVFQRPGSSVFAQIVIGLNAGASAVETPILGLVNSFWIW